ACLPFSGQLVSDVASAPAAATWNVVYLGVFPTAIAFTTWFYALARTTAGKMGATTYIVPALVVLMSWLLIDEIPGWLGFVGGALCLVGVAVTRSKFTLRGPKVPAETAPATADLGPVLRIFRQAAPRPDTSRRTKTHRTGPSRRLRRQRVAALRSPSIARP
ncbi:MAG: DMT family transporter, partial [Stackebrandtia sp.]